jgi:hypothetical protein
MIFIPPEPNEMGKNETKSEIKFKNYTSPAIIGVIILIKWDLTILDVYKHISEGLIIQLNAIYEDPA